tara:strand:+ start:1084 stop:1854 length:771 start_codon:yes stop_codon:yes gene_type:complete
MAEETEGEVAVEEPQGLLDDAKITEPETETEVEELDHIDPESNGERPDWLPQRFWDDDKGADYEGLAKSQQELYKKLRSGKHDAPEDGNYDMKFADGRIAEDDELMTKFKTLASERGFTQDDVESVLGLVLDATPAEQDEPEAKFDRETEINKLGPNGEEIINGTVKWVEGMVNNGALTAEDFEEFKIVGGTANGIRFLNRVRQYYGERNIPVNSTPDLESVPTEAELQEMVADPRYREDTSFRNKVTADFKRLYG